jgi:ABC-type Zn uptake system ZnuABC Zn-binding protein ZnuA
VLAKQSSNEAIITLDQSEIKVVATMNFIGDFVQALLGEKATVTNLITANQDPHFYEPDSSDLTAMSEADLILGLGSPEFDQWLIDYIDQSGDSSLKAKTTYVANATALEKVDPITNQKNPHFWLNPENAELMVNNTADLLIDRNLVNLSDIKTNWDAYLVQLESINTLMETTSAQENWNGKKVVVDHPAFFYFLDKLGFDRVAAVEVKEGEEPSPQHIQDITETMSEQNIDLIIASEIQAGSAVQELARNTGAMVAYLTPLPGIDGASNYTEMIRYNLNALKNPVAVTSNASLNSIYSIIGLLLIPIVRKFGLTSKNKMTRF